ncbi:enoyl-CoA hydratase [Noviherbaspirillum humi]|uniref:Enoyl-CoA hydratase n=1 Tax=Noviherbaspirillum humi TaxID=1688639 RepID=A0A239LVW8_9BURK|nr:enoyl-CoA hydratase [Noviherbaspirillum humi]SNT34410.1 enoyl-CoA hydratase [Noviherbaspirillum humi]
MGLLDIEKREGLALLRLNDPQRRNLLSSGLCRELIAAVKEANADESVRAIVICAAGKAFCAGADLDDLKAAAAGDTAAVQDVYDAFLTVADSPLPTLALVQGPAVGAGMNLALACDARIVGSAGSFDTRFLQIGLHPGGGHTWMLLRAVGWETASRLLLFSRTVKAEEAVRIGLAAEQAPNEELEAAALALLANLRNTPRELLLRTKASLRQAAASSHQESYKHETAEQMWSLHQPAFEKLVSDLQFKLGKRGD